MGPCVNIYWSILGAPVDFERRCPRRLDWNSQPTLLCQKPHLLVWEAPASCVKSPTLGTRDGAVLRAWECSIVRRCDAATGRTTRSFSDDVRLQCERVRFRTWSVRATHFLVQSGGPWRVRRPQSLPAPCPAGLRTTGQLPLVGSGRSPCAAELPCPRPRAGPVLPLPRPAVCRVGDSGTGTVSARPRSARRSESTWLRRARNRENPECPQTARGPKGTWRSPRPWTARMECRRWRGRCAFRQRGTQP